MERNSLAATMRAISTNPERSPLDAKIDVVETACLKRGILVTADGYVRQADAAALLGVSPYTLRNQRLNGGATIASRPNGRIIEYAIAGIAAALLAREK
ncbi:hypothetical protein MesoLj113a_38520 [Mesorhizobium sp. 113-1-2]|uniref:hypothetical protein n=1 Tax=Mesorhizobium sp. 113-1-2 TaxID=2744515 RepID=UPI0019293534|nr:hypothetical protein [Mesorhizobium sp. 113-1-2]BCG72694.1 hypothetical protein MesoLj113a_38520 [Mesorhizobium sp. 113-1-2]